MQNGIGMAMIKVGTRMAGFPLIGIGATYVKRRVPYAVVHVAWFDTVVMDRMQPHHAIVVKYGMDDLPFAHAYGRRRKSAPHHAARTAVRKTPHCYAATVIHQHGTAHVDATRKCDIGCDFTCRCRCARIGVTRTAAHSSA